MWRAPKGFDSSSFEEEVGLAAMSTFGQFLRVTTYGESHCASVGCIVDNFPPGVPISEDILQPQVNLHVIMTKLDDTDVLL